VLGARDVMMMPLGDRDIRPEGVAERIDECWKIKPGIDFRRGDEPHGLVRDPVVHAGEVAAAGEIVGLGALGLVFQAAHIALGF